MAQLAPAIPNDQVQLGFSRLMSASARMTQGLLEFQIASAKLTGDFWIDALNDATRMTDPPSAPKGLEASLRSMKARCDRAVHEMREINDRVLACSFECAEAALEGVAAAAPIGNELVKQTKQAEK